MVFFTYVVDPVDVGTDPGEDRGLLVVVAAHAGAKTNHAVHIPGAIGTLAVQGSARISLKSRREMCMRLQLRLYVCLWHTKEKWLTLQLASWPSPPAQTMLVVTRVPHQSYLLQVSWPTMGRRACCRMSAIGPPAGEKKRTHLVPTGPSTDSFWFFEALTPETAPSGHIAGRIVWQDFARCGKTCGHDGVSCLDRSWQLDQCNVIAMRQESQNDIFEHKMVAEWTQQGRTGSCKSPRPHGQWSWRDWWRWHQPHYSSDCVCPGRPCRCNRCLGMQKHGSELPWVKFSAKYQHFLNMRTRCSEQQ